MQNTIMRFKEMFAVFLVMVAVVMTGLHGAKVIDVPEMVLGALWTMGFVIVVQYYFRKGEPTRAGTGNPGGT